MIWITRERPKIDRIACPWLLRRFIDKDQEFLFVPAPRVLAVATQTGAVPYDLPDVEFSHVGELCSFDAFLRRYQLTDRALTQLAAIVRGADTGRPELAPQAAGLLAVSLGLSAIFADDHELLQHGMVIYDALCAWCRSCQGEVHSSPPNMAAC
jgi:hypothetical protein